MGSPESEIGRRYPEMPSAHPGRAGAGWWWGGHQVVRALLALLVLTATCRTGSCHQRARVGLSPRPAGGVVRAPPGGNRANDADDQPPDTEIHVAPLPRRPDSVVPPRYYDAPHNVNPHPYKYVLNNPNLCMERQEVLLLMVVRTVGAHVDRRMAVRDTWAASFNLPGVTMPLVFLLGAARDRAEQKEINLENRIYRDLIQEDFADTDNNRTLKTVMAYKWARAYCPHADFVMVSDDDVVVDIFKLVPYLQSLQQYRSVSQFVLCYQYPCCMLAEYPRAAQGLSPLGYDIYSGQAFPAHCSSSLYIASSSVIHKLYLMSLDTPMFVPEAPWVGVLSEKLGLSFSQTFRSYVGIDPNANDLEQQILRRFNSSDYLATPVMVGVVGRAFPRREADMVRRLWSLILANHRDKPPLDVKRYMGAGGGREDGDNHIYQVALAALLIDLAVMAIIGYIIFCRKRPKVGSFHSSAHYHYPR